ncbi:uncharacterized protein LOC129593547 [Paramacrobiotus metropolitanus]|uniref:uncharacterized protein LOC129593547 n=1 Tax=Paramacrobiotus metropolitanus TaxID=2943436 RepID=UPI002445F07D|nr:uncharacterized protein LOC129593547 [Paramacrobiotus metropolitanus]XP_055345892.1 uncharacterized protein LOC129593547 [Paramacrobiotus metropolitanus]
MAQHEQFMNAAIEEAEKGLKENGLPIGSVLVRNGQIIGRGRNQRVQKDSVILHAEMDAIENAGRGIPYEECILYTTLAPCAMCSGTILFFQIKHVVVGENETLNGEEALLRQRGVKVEVLNNARCREMLKGFIEKNPDLWQEDGRDVLTEK